MNLPLQNDRAAADNARRYKHDDTTGTRLPNVPFTVKPATFLAITFLCIGIAAAVCMVFTPQIMRHLGPGHSVKGPGYAEGAAIAAFAVVCVLALISVVASLLAWFAARHAGLSVGMLWSCWLPVVLAAIAGLWWWSKLSD